MEYKDILIKILEKQKENKSIYFNDDFVNCTIKCENLILICERDVYYKLYNELKNR